MSVIPIPVVMVGLFLVSVAGCVTPPPAPIEPTPDLDAERAARLKQEAAERLNTMLSRAVVDAQATRRMLAEVNNAARQEDLSRSKKREAMVAAIAVPFGLDKPIKLEGAMTLEKGLAAVAKATRYNVEILGEPPVPALPVTYLDGIEEPAINVIRELSYRYTDAVNVTVIEAGRKIRLEYLR